MKKRNRNLILSIAIFIILVYMFPGCFGFLFVSDKQRFKIVMEELYADEIIPRDIRLEGTYCTSHARENTFVFYGATTNKLFFTNNDAIKESELSRYTHLSDAVCSRCAYWVDESDFDDNIDMVVNYIKHADASFEWTAETRLYRKLTRALHNTVWVVPDQNGIIVVYWSM